MTFRLSLLLTTLVSVTLTGAALAPSTADACGGFVCSTTPPPDPPPTFTPGTPVNQSGESVIYAKEPDGTLSMTVQIRYEGDTGDFAWILPVPVPPEISVGTDAAFAALRAATEPRFETTRRTEGTCAREPECEPRTIDCSRMAFADASAPADFSFSSDMGAGPPVTVYSQGPVGPYETAVIGSSSADEVIRWLNDAGFGLPEDASAPLQEYADEGSVFVALRMATDASTDLIQPVTLRMATEEMGCLPLRLTRIAAVTDMPITTYFLGDARVIPSNYSMVRVPLEATPELWLGTRRWSGAVGAVVDTVGGQGFVTEYAKETPAVDVRLPSIDDLADIMDVGEFVGSLVARGFDDATTTLPTLEAHIEPPEGMTTLDYLNCLARGFPGSCGEPRSFDPAAIVAQLTASEVVPREEFHALATRHPHLTRMSTAMDPDEMTVDPLFEVDPLMPEVDNVHMAERVTRCSGDYYEAEAPVDLVIGDRTHNLEPGTPRSGSTRCRPVPPLCADAGPEAGSDAGPDADDDDDGCSVGATPRSPLPAFLLLIAMAIAVRLRHR